MVIAPAPRFPPDVEIEFQEPDIKDSRCRLPVTSAGQPAEKTLTGAGAHA